MVKETGKQEFPLPGVPHKVFQNLVDELWKAYVESFRAGSGGAQTHKDSQVEALMRTEINPLHASAYYVSGGSSQTPGTEFEVEMPLPRKRVAHTRRCLGWVSYKRGEYTLIRSR